MSVGWSFKCPWCGRLGKGGYAHDAVGYPVCTEGENSCLWFQIMKHGIVSKAEYNAKVLHAQIPKIQLLEVHWGMIAAFL